MIHVLGIVLASNLAGGTKKDSDSQRSQHEDPRQRNLLRSCGVEVPHRRQGQHE